MQNEFLSDVSLNLWCKLIVIHSIIHFLPLSLREYEHATALFVSLLMVIDVDA